MKSIKEKAKAYDEAIERASKLRVQNPFDTVSQMMEYVFPELKESEDERIRKELIEFLNQFYSLGIHGNYERWEKADCSEWIAWLEKQGGQKPCMIQWKGDNLKEVIDFTGKDKNFEKWFKSFEEYEKYVDDHNGIFKLFNADGSHYEIPVGAWIIKTPDGYNVASKAKYKQKPTDKVKLIIIKED